MASDVQIIKKREPAEPDAASSINVVPLPDKYITPWWARARQNTTEEIPTLQIFLATSFVSGEGGGIGIASKLCFAQPKNKRDYNPNISQSFRQKGFSIRRKGLEELGISCKERLEVQGILHALGAACETHKESLAGQGLQDVVINSSSEEVVRLISDRVLAMMTEANMQQGNRMVKSRGSQLESLLLKVSNKVETLSGNGLQVTIHLNTHHNAGMALAKRLAKRRGATSCRSRRKEHASQLKRTTG